MILDRILESKRAELDRCRKAESVEGLRTRPLYASDRRGFTRTIEAKTGRSIIAEIKKASPSKGIIREDFDPARHARDYQDAGAVCLSVLTDSEFFSGSIEDLVAAHAASSLPILRKDFTMDPYQIVEARAAGADAVLLIVAALDPVLFAELAGLAAEEGLDSLVEVHDEAELETALKHGARLIGVNNRNLRTFETSLETSRRLLPQIPAGVTVVSESGLERRDELDELEACGCHAFLVGEALMRAPHPGRALAGLL